MPLKTICNQCDKKLYVPSKFAGLKHACPHCQAMITIPDVKKSNQTSRKKFEPKPEPLPNIDVFCNRCQTKLSAPSDFAGKKIKCPRCQDILSIPELNLS
ncbi:MAG: hypothetical protein ACKVH8_04855 [Pirellulales bacterium]